MQSSAGAEIRLRMPVNEVWARMRDLSIPHFYVPGLTGTRMHPGPSEGVGASRRVFQKGKPPLDETVTEWREGQGFVIRLHSGDKPPPLFREASFIYAIEDAGGGETLFRPSMAYTLPWGRFGQWLDRVLLNRVIRGIVLKVGLSLKRYYETGQPSNPAWKGR